MEKSRQELIDNYKAEQRAKKVRKVLDKTKDWGENLLGLLIGGTMALTVLMVCVTLWRLGLGIIVMLAGVTVVAVCLWMVFDLWVDSEQEKARERWNKERRGEY